ncbi:MAG: hypothetical protein PHH23_05080 [Paludibacteraceae bacterium]|nr:hypothetical protein [Paludibacteraceae bacterium]
MLSIESQGIKIEQPQIKGYIEGLSLKTDPYHNFPTAFDDIIIQGGEMNVTGSGGLWYTAPGSINGTNGFYTIGINQQGIIYHRCFYQILPTLY